jgi:hypothetical protein
MILLVTVGTAWELAAPFATEALLLLAPRQSAIA